MKTSLKDSIDISIQSLYLVLSWSNFGSSYSLQSPSVWGYKISTPGFGDILPQRVQDLRILFPTVRESCRRQVSFQVFLLSSSPSGHSSRQVACRNDNDALGTLSCLHTGSLELRQSGRWVPGRSLWSAGLFLCPFRNDGGLCALGKTSLEQKKCTSTHTCTFIYKTDRYVSL